MTATNHALTGALVAVALKRPEVAIPVAFVAHFIMDTVPHFDFKTDTNILKRNRSKVFVRILIVDSALALALLILLPVYLKTKVDWWVIAASMVACMSPDLVWGYRYFFELKNKVVRRKNWFSRFHARLQWSETVGGLAVESAWFILGISLVLFIRA